jgi:hypothetical protein
MVRHIHLLYLFLYLFMHLCIYHFIIYLFYLLFCLCLLFVLFIGNFFCFDVFLHSFLVLTPPPVDSQRVFDKEQDNEFTEPALTIQFCAFHFYRLLKHKNFLLNAEQKAFLIYQKKASVVHLRNLLRKEHHAKEVCLFVCLFIYLFCWVPLFFVHCLLSYFSFFVPFFRMI